MPVKNRFAELHDEITAWRRDFHAHPETLFDLPRTSGIVADKLRAFGCDEVATGLAQSGVIGVIHGRQNSSGKTIALRADMDALPIHEATGKPYASQTPGKMHACGHDGHTAMVLGAAKYLAETRNFNGTCVVLFQPAEEGGGGANVMLEEGLLDQFPIDEFYGMHNAPNLEAGAFAIRPGPFYGFADQFNIIVTGRAGHAAQPHQTIDATVAASHIVLALQSIVSRNADPVSQAVVSVTAMATDSTTHNVIAGEVRMTGTVRAFDAAIGQMVQDRMARIVEMTASAYGATATLEYEPGYPVLDNTPEQTAFAADVATRVAGHCDEAPMIMWGEDFSYFLQKRPGAYIWMGIGPSPSVHHPEYDFNDAVIPAGCSYFAELIERRMPVD